jgi:geranylgeranyl diphosphate synthase type I
MSSAVKPDSLAAALDAALRRFDGASPVTEQVHYHFGESDPARRDDARRWMELVLTVAQAEGGAERATDAAAAVAILHQYTRVHADVGAAGGSSVSAHFGLAHGINAGDALSALAYLQLLVDPAVERPAEQTVAMTRALQEANYAMCGGTPGALLGAACELGALAAGASPERAQTYGRIGRACAELAASSTIA